MASPTSLIWMPSFLRDLIQLYSKIGYQKISPDSEETDFYDACLATRRLRMSMRMPLRAKGQHKMENSVTLSPRYIYKDLPSEIMPGCVISRMADDYRGTIKVKLGI